MLRRQFPDALAEVRIPSGGVNLRTPPQELLPIEALALSHWIVQDGLRPLPGVRRLTPTPLATASQITGGAKILWASGAASQRLVTYGSSLARLDDAGSASVITSSFTAHTRCGIVHWPITDTVYFSTGTMPLSAYDGATWGVLSGTNIPTPKVNSIVPVADRLLCIGEHGIERTNARTATVWSANSAWATLRPMLGGPFTALVPYSLRTTGFIADGALAFQARAVYLISGSDYGTDVAAASPSSGEDVSIRLVDGTIGTVSPFGVCSVPGIGLFWITADAQIYHLPDGQTTGYYVSHPLRHPTDGLGAIVHAALPYATLTYFDQWLIVRVPGTPSPWTTIEWWGDLRQILARDGQLAWYGPHLHASWSVLWTELHDGAPALLAGEGDPAIGAYVYRAMQWDYAGHDVGNTTRFMTARWTTGPTIGTHLAPSGGVRSTGRTQKYLRSVQVMTVGAASQAPAFAVHEVGESPRWMTAMRLSVATEQETIYEWRPSMLLHETRDEWGVSSPDATIWSLWIDAQGFVHVADIPKPVLSVGVWSTEGIHPLLVSNAGIVSVDLDTVLPDSTPVASLRDPSGVEWLLVVEHGILRLTTALPSVRLTRYPSCTMTWTPATVTDTIHVLAVRPDMTVRRGGL